MVLTYSVFDAGADSQVVKEYRKKEETFSRLHSMATKSSAGSSSDPSPRQRLKAAGATAMVAASVKRATSSEQPPAAVEQPAALWAEKSEVQNLRGWTRDAEVCKADVSFSDMQAMAGSTQRMMENLEGGDTLEELMIPGRRFFLLLMTMMDDDDDDD